MSSRAGGLYGGIQFSSAKAFSSPLILPQPSTSESVPSTGTTDPSPTKEQSSSSSASATAPPAIDPATSSIADAAGNSAVKASAGISSYSAALPL